MHPLITATETSLTCLQEMAESTALRFMSSRNTHTRINKDHWSDISVRVDLIEGRLRVQWRKRQWLNLRNQGKQSRRYISKHIPNRMLIKLAREHEKQEVSECRDRLAAIKAMHNTYLKLGRQLHRMGLTRDEADIEVGFVPKDYSARLRASDGRYVDRQAADDSD